MARTAVSCLAWLLAAMALLYFLSQVVLPAASRNTYAFSVYYTSSRLALHGEADARICGQWFYEQQHILGFGDRADAFCGFGPPTMAVVMMPVAGFPPDVARAIWVSLDLGMIAAIIAIAWHFANGNGRLSPHLYTLFIPMSLVVAVLFWPIRAEIRAGQIHLLLALLYALWLYGFATRGDRLCGAALAALTLAKLGGLPLWIFMFCCRRWRALGWSAGLVAIALAAAVPFFTLEFWQIDLQKVLATTGRPEAAAPAYQTLLSLLRQTFQYDPQWAPRPLLDAPWAPLPLLAAVAIILIAATLAAHRKGLELHAAMAMLCIIVPLQPAGEQYHYAQLFVVLLILIASSKHLRENVMVHLILCVAMSLFALPPYFLHTNAFSGLPAALLAYPRLYGALMLWGLLTFASAPREATPNLEYRSGDKRLLVALRNRAGLVTGGPGQPLR
jgi:hypothetical protein